MTRPAGAGEAANELGALGAGRVHLIAAEEFGLYSGERYAAALAELVREVFGLPCVVIDDPVSHTPLVVPATGDWDRGPAGAGTAGAVE